MRIFYGVVRSDSCQTIYILEKFHISTTPCVYVVLETLLCIKHSLERQSNTIIRYTINYNYYDNGLGFEIRFVKICKLSIYVLSQYVQTVIIASVSVITIKLACEKKSYKYVLMKLLLKKKRQNESAIVHSLLIIKLPWTLVGIIVQDINC